MQTDDRILPVTRIVAVIVVPFLWLAFLILFFLPPTSPASALPGRSNRT
jgi:hypothetical protein